MAKFWLPIPFMKKYQRGNKTTILIIPGASQMDRSQLKEIICCQEEKIAKEPVKPSGYLPSEDVKGMLLEFANYIRKKRKW